MLFRSHSGIEHDIYNLTKDPNKIIKTSSYHGNILDPKTGNIIGKNKYAKVPLDKEMVEFFIAHPDIIAKVYKVHPNYMVVEKLNTKKFLDENEKLIKAFKKHKIYNSHFLDDGENPEQIIHVLYNMLQSDKIIDKLFNITKKEGIDDILSRWIIFLEKLKKYEGKYNIDLHNGNLGYDNEGKIKLLDI